MKINEATDEEIKLGKISAIKKLVGDDSDRFNLDDMSTEDLDGLLAELTKASMQENTDFKKAYNKIMTIYRLCEKYGFKRDEAEIVLGDIAK